MADVQGVYRLIGVDDTGGVFEIASSKFIPNDLANTDWRTYLAWKADNDATADAAIGLTTLEDYKLDAKTRIDLEADQEIARQVASFGGAFGLAGGRAALGFVYGELLREAWYENIDGTPTVGDYPLCNSLVSVLGATDFQDAASKIRTEWSAVVAGVAAVLQSQRAAHIDIDAAASEAAVDAVRGGVDFPIYPAAAAAFPSTSVSGSVGSGDNLLAPIAASAETLTLIGAVGVTSGANQTVSAPAVSASLSAVTPSVT